MKYVLVVYEAWFPTPRECNARLTVALGEPVVKYFFVVSHRCWMEINLFASNKGLQPGKQLFCCGAAVPKSATQEETALDGIIARHGS